jgi:branched-chain amino acid transport system ATP-binding protein
MLSLGMAFIAKPRLLMIDELSLGLAPTIIDMLLEIVQQIHENGTTVVLVEQSVNTALKLAHRCVFMEKGEVRFSGPTAELLQRPDVLRAVYLEGSASAVASGDGVRGARAGRARAGPATKVSGNGDERPVTLETVGLTKHYGGITANDDVSLQVREGEIVGLIGPNGAGKTSLFDVISGFTEPDAGRLYLLGQDVTDLAAHLRSRRGLARSFQDSRLWPSLTVREALAVSFEHVIAERSALAAVIPITAVTEAEAEVSGRVDELLQLLGLQAFRDKFVSELSTGSKRIVEIAATMAQRPAVLILDEPSSGIAQKETEELLPFLRGVRDQLDCSMLVIEHDMNLITRLADRIYALDQGAVVAMGTPDEIVRHPRVVESYLGSMAQELQTGGSAPRRPPKAKIQRQTRTTGLKAK